jgi:asparagine synthetase B (glutamine-hydrolysing)
MNLILDNASFLKNNKKIKISRTRDLNLYFKLSFKNGFYIRKDLKNKIFFILSQKELIFSNSLKNLIKHKNLINLDKNIIDTYKKTGFIPPPYTIFKNVFCVPYFSGIKITNKLFQMKKFFPEKSTPFKNQNDFENFMRSIINDYSKKNRLLLFSGGSDSLFIFYNLLKKKKYSLKNIIVKMKGMEKDFYRAKKISKFYNIQSITFNNFSFNIKKNINTYIRNHYEPIQDPIVPIYIEIINKNLSKGNEIFFDGQGSDSLLMGLPHNFLINLYNPFLSNIFVLVNKFFIFNVTPNSRIKRLYYRIGKIVKALAQNNWISCFLSSIYIEKNDKLFDELYLSLENYYSHFKCKHKSIAFFFITIILDSREMQKYRSLSKKARIALPFLDNKLIEKVFSTRSNFFIKSIYKKKPIYNFINKKKFKINNLKTSPFFVDYSIDKKEHDIYQYSLKKLSKLLN